MEDLLIPIFVCVVLPVSIVWIIFRNATNSDNKRAEVLIKAIESNQGIDADKLAAAFAKPTKAPKTPRQRLIDRLLCGCIFTLVGIALILTFFILNQWNVYGGWYFFFIAGAVSLAVGLSFLIVYFITRKQVEE